MKKLMGIVLAIALLTTMFAACSKDQGDVNDQTGQEAEDQTVEETADNSEVMVGLVCDVAGLGDQSINDQAQSGMDTIASDYGVTVKTVEPADESQVLDMIQSFVEMDFDLTVCNAFSHEEALTQVAQASPESNFMILDTVVDLPNVMSFTYATHQGSFLAGVAAALKTQSNVIGFIGGMNIPTIQKFETGFIEGIHYINPDIQVITKYIGNDGSAWNDPATAKSLTLDIISNGGDVVYHAAGGSGLGMIEACVEKDVWAIGVNIDQSHLAPENMLTSMLTRGDVAINIATKTLLDGEDITGHVLLTCENEGVGIVMNDNLSDEEKAKIEEVKDKIISGEIVVTDVMGQ